MYMWTEPTCYSFEYLYWISTNDQEIVLDHIDSLRLILCFVNFDSSLNWMQTISNTKIYKKIIRKEKIVAINLVANSFKLSVCVLLSFGSFSLRCV